MLEQVRIKPYHMESSNYMLQASELYSGGENDPFVSATIHALDHAAKDSNGNNLPFSLICNILAQNIDREKEMLEDKPITYRRWDQKIEIQIIVWCNERDKEIFENNDNVYLV
jgi:hypothetical protein